MKTLHTSLGEYAVAAEPDLQTLFGMMENCRGKRRAVHFEDDAGLCHSSYHKLKKHKKGITYSSQNLEKMVAARDKNSNVTTEAAFAANGMIPLQKLTRILFALKPEKKDVQDLRKREYAQPQYVHCDYYPDDRERFLSDLVFFAVYLSEPEIQSVNSHLEVIFQDKALVRMLYKYHKHKADELTAVKKVLMEKETEVSPLASYYFKEIQKQIHNLDEGTDKPY